MKLAVRVALVLTICVLPFLMPNVGLARGGGSGSGGGGGGGGGGGTPPPSAGPSVASLVLNPNSVVGGASTSGTVVLSGAAPAAGASVALASLDTTAVTVPAQVTVPAGQTSATFTATSKVVPSTKLVTLTASYGGLSTGAILTVAAAAAPGSGTLAGLSINPETVIGGESSVGTVRLVSAVSAPTVVSLTSTDTSVASVPASVTVLAGATSATFPVTTRVVSGAGTFSWISGATGSAIFGASINVNPGAPPGAPTMVSLVLTPNSTGGGGASTGTIKLSAPANDGAIFTVTSSNPAVVQVPVSEVVVSARQATAAFPITTVAVSATTSVTITATARCCGAAPAARSAVMTVTTALPPPPDVVRITSASWRRCILSIRATSSNPNAILTLVSTASGGELFRLDNLGNGNYSASRAWRPPGTNVPVPLTVRSNFGGSAQITLADPEGFVCRADL